MWQVVLHYGNHFLVILLIAWFYDRQNLWRNYFVLLATMLVDIDHLWAEPIFDPKRCSIGFHTFHSEIAILIYFGILIFVQHKTIRLIAIGLIFHMITDGIDCLWLNFESFSNKLLTFTKI
ncbi:DUF6122 family protein [Psychroflexus aestuariivivens]|uniref:DUF6122 family protein n=1 Tax=Psychroflexus aestuariivivens TaxID=1795040 RepID=UPI000FD9A4AD|nr:DUF6122 family protein [Psychroflexus aestuariivivens]